MEPLNLKIQRSFNYLLLSVYSLFVLIPLSFALLTYITDFDSSLLSPLFFWVLVKATLFAFLQASTSVLAVAAFSYYTVAYFQKHRASQRAIKFLELSGFLGFSLSPTLVALSLIFSFSILTNRMPSGFWAIVLCHFLLNAAYFSSQFFKKVERFFAREGEALSLYLRSLGANNKTQRRLLIWPLFVQDFKSWFPQVFLWCFMSFAPIVLLSANTGQNTPELLLYYSLLNDPSGSRMLVIFALSASLSFFLTRYARRLPHTKMNESYSPSVNPKSSLLSNSALILLSFFLIFPFLFTLLSPFFNDIGRLQGILPSLLPTFLIFIGTFILSLLFGISSALCSKELKLISFSNFISAPMLLIGFINFETSNPYFAYLLISLGSFLALFPWAHRRVRSFVESLPDENKSLALTLGMRNFSYFRYYLWPEIGPALWRLSLLFSLWSLGEYTFSKALLNRNETLALFIEENLRRYQFNEASLALSLSLSISVIVVTALLWKGRKNVAL